MSCSSDETQGLYSLAARDASGRRNPDSEQKHCQAKAALKNTGAKSQPEALLLDSRNSLTPAGIVQDNVITMPPLSVALLQV